ncbi:hypothetical protein GT204_06700 [Streptomyces sp. SID4919]|uniref:hypothetical protein n=1 Tax=Streptomyces TaxID=1883 RepID=UPI00136FBAB9|nr:MULTISPECIES: hypothetical protein [unclassified Streptomyces]MYY08606.1 hypothetical protein [Streptomyces sp. SID4919]
MRPRLAGPRAARPEGQVLAVVGAAPLAADLHATAAAPSSPPVLTAVLEQAVTAAGG